MVKQQNNCWTLIIPRIRFSSHFMKENGNFKKAHQFLIRIIGNNKKEETTRLKNKKEKGKKRGRDERREKRRRGGREEKNSFAVGNGEHERTSTTLNKEEMSKDGRGERIEETRTERGKGPGKRRECRQTEQPENVWAADDESVGNRAPGDLPANC
ncbi:hypothetical protein niasHT_011390 [Heterodera trifolii]|uniref:Uncharacterized protein n=1 Tax=Heterodera trifolii TaxID=157864 RepID=A0ABD2LKX3_9BILA